jgi:hypothetical protein
MPTGRLGPSKSGRSVLNHQVGTILLAFLLISAEPIDVVRAFARAGVPDAHPASLSREGREPDHYLLLVNTAFASDMNPQKIGQFGRSAYEGLAVAFSGNYDVSAAPGVADISAKIAEWRKISGKDIWPWVFLNRIIAANPAQNNPHNLHEPYFRRIQGMDLENKTGAREDFLEIWGNSLAAARESGAPGVFFDPEFYNNYAEYDPREIAKRTGKTVDETELLLQQLGARMADAAANRYPEAELWFSFTSLSHPGYTDGTRQFSLAPAYIVTGLLDEIQKQHFGLRVISGGEVGLEGYCHPSLAELQNQIQNRAAAFAPYLRKYGGSLELAGTMTVWSDRKLATGAWVKQGDCAACPASTIEELQPYIELLLRSYRYNWIWGSGEAGYAAFDPGVSPRFDAVIGSAKAHALAAREH